MSTIEWVFEREKFFFFSFLQGDKEFKVAIQFKLYEFPMLSAKVLEASKSCIHTVASREILCDTNFMEASNFIFLYRKYFVISAKIWTSQTLHIVCMYQV